MIKTSVVIIGAGLSGLTVARQLQHAGVDFIMLESEVRPGGRIKTENYNGFLLDHGFQVYLDAYSEGKQAFDYTELNLHAFDSGALILLPNGKMTRFYDPLKHPKHLLSIFNTAWGSLEDKLNLFSLRARLLNQRNAYLFEKNDYPTSKVLDRYGFSDTIKHNFLQPFFRGIFLEKNLETSRRMFDFVLKMFSKGNATLPLNGMEALIQQLVASIPNQHIHCGKSVVRIENHIITTHEGDCYQADYIIMASAVNKLLPLHNQSPEIPINDNWKGCTTVYYSCDSPPYKDKLIALNTLDNALVNNIAVLSNVNPSYAPPGKSLISATIIGVDNREDAHLADLVQQEMKLWFGSNVETWNLLKVYRIPHALPTHSSVMYDINPENVKLNDYIFLCGDHILQGSIQGALRSGRQTAAFLLDQIKK